MAGPAIVIFGAAVRHDGTPSTTLRLRVEAAVACAQCRPGALFVPTGGIGRHGPAEAEVMAALLRGHGIAESRILREPTGSDTLSSVRAVVRLLRGAYAPVLVATSAYHLPRCLLLLRMAGLPARPCRPPAVPAARSFRRRCYWRLREALALPFDALLLLALRAARRI